MTIYPRAQSLLALIHQNLINSVISPNISLILGQPGSGKTETIPAIKSYLVDKGFIEAGGIYVVSNKDDVSGLVNFIDANTAEQITEQEEKSGLSSPKQRVVVFDEFNNGISPLLVKQVLSFGIPVIVMAQGNKDAIKSAFQERSTGAHLDAQYLADHISLVVEYTFLIEGNLGYEAMLAIAGMPLFTTTDGYGDLSLNNTSVLSHSSGIKTIERVTSTLEC